MATASGWLKKANIIGLVSGCERLLRSIAASVFIVELVLQLRRSREKAAKPSPLGVECAESATSAEGSAMRPTQIVLNCF
jgi:hypothetical protein